MLCLDSWNSNDWSYLGEGNANIVLKYLGTNDRLIGKVLRVRKEESFQLQNAEFSQQFLKRIVARLLGHDVIVHYEVVQVTYEFLNAMMCSIQRPAYRLEKTVNFNSTAALILKDVTQPLTIELKPKWGFKPHSQFIKHLKLKEKHCRFCMHSHFRHLNIGDYCPLDLYSANPSKVKRAIRALLTYPDLKKTLKMSMDSMTMDDIEYVLGEILVRDSILKRLQTLQKKLDRLDVEGIMPLYNKYQPYKSDIAIWEKIVDNYLSGTDGDLQRLYEYVLSMTFKDCSLLINMKKVEKSESKAIKMGEYYIEYDIKVIDVDVKNIDKIPYWFKLDQLVQKGQKRSTPVVLYRAPEKLYKLIDFKLPDQGINIEDLFELVQLTLDYSVNPWNPRFLDKLYAGTNPIGVLSELLLSVLNTNAHVYQVSPVLTLMEVEVTRAVGQLLDMGKNAGGLFCPGGSASNLLAMTTARNRLFPSIKTEGYYPYLSDYGKLKVYTSLHSHYSIDKAAQILGLGLNNVVKIPVDNTGKMIAEELEKYILKTIEEGDSPFFINATAGTTVLGAFDPIQSISEIAKRYRCWLHIDGSFGGSTVFSENAKGMLNGSAHVDTFTLNPHKLLGVPLQCSMLLTPHENLFTTSNGLNADYLFHGNPYDLGAGTLGCGRRPDSVKMFLAWKFYGKEGFGKRMDRALRLANQFTDMVRERPNFVLVCDPSPFLQICFWFVPPTLANQKKSLSLVTRELHKRVIESGKFLVDHSPLEGVPDFFRVVVNSPTVRLHADLQELLDVIEQTSESVDWSQLL
ncbi:hypothetical protein CU098_012072 [Rhizopus stolonifer]|uniref:Uncharacterized protein n=1 Tax=Rhizopus stolonifer TaxID=4846 RepID=A0A367KRK3_RHIST|nr:hypothetical protein CU098_012072 [Rhizopus stolonifer]